MIHLRVGPERKDNVKLGELLNGFRADVGYSRAEAATRLGVSSEYIRLIERGARAPALGFMRNMLNQYEVDFVMGVKKITINNEIEVTSTSRILEARQSNTPSPRLHRNRSEMLGEIVTLLSEADDELLDTIRMFLLVKARGENISSNEK